MKYKDIYDYAHQNGMVVIQKVTDGVATVSVGKSSKFDSWQYYVNHNNTLPTDFELIDYLTFGYTLDNRDATFEERLRILSEELLRKRLFVEGLKTPQNIYDFALGNNMIVLWRSYDDIKFEMSLGYSESSHDYIYFKENFRKKPDDFVLVETEIKTFASRVGDQGIKWEIKRLGDSIFDRIQNK